MQKYLTQALALVKSLWAKEPTRVVSVVAAAVVFVAAKVGVIVPVESVANAIAFAVPLLIGGELIRTQVSPAIPVVPVVPSTPSPKV
jgi:hypothetical protein